ncbi:MAG TPA: terminase family protein [Bryobacteraceae bacterium]|nr:terminase family protein [Bryobacteraceae bacterium]
MDRKARIQTISRGIEYSKLPSQARFHNSEARFKGYSGSIGSGKSQALCQEAIKLSYVNGGRTGLIGAPTYPMLRDATLPTLLHILDENGLPYELSKAESVIRMKDTGSRILLRAVEEYDRLRGTNLAWFGIDELSYTQEESWLRLEGRLRDPKATQLRGFAVWTPKGFDWVYSRFIANPVAGYAVIQAEPFENRFILDKVPDFYERLKASYDDKFFRQEVLGEYLSANSGLVYNQFNKIRHVDEEVRVNQSLPLLWALDFNVNPMSSIIAQVQGTEVAVLDEIVIPRASTTEACDEFLRKFPRHAGGLVVYGDASGNSMKTSGTTDYDIMRGYFRNTHYARIDYRVPRANPAVRERILTVNGRLQSAAGTSSLKVSPLCKNLILDFEQVMYKPDTAVIDKEKDSKRTHVSDALGYLLWQIAKDSQQPIGPQRNRLF